MQFEDGKQRHNFCKALLSAFPTYIALQQMLSFGLNKNLHEIATGENHSEVVFKVVTWAETYNKLPELVETVCNPEYGNPGNPQLKAFCQKYSRSQLVEEPVKQQSQPTPKPLPEQPKPKPITPPQIEEDDLSSETGVDYTRLRDLLKAGNWKEADEETLTVMLKCAGREKEGWLDSDSIKKFPCTDLRTIDQLWVKYSNARFGFSVQKRIWESVGKDTEKFGDRVGWCKIEKRKKEEGWLLWKEEKIELYYKWLSYNDINFSILAPEGHLPAVGGFFIVIVISEIKEILASRLVKCNI
ncbi:MAG: GUN4 domain-containing protein [Rivularia sp. (in: cyanobacteria)]